MQEPHHPDVAPKQHPAENNDPPPSSQLDDASALLLMLSCPEGQMDVEPPAPSQHGMLIGTANAPASKRTVVKFAGHGRVLRCGACEGCRRSDCGRCPNCRDKPKFGGTGVKKQSCQHRRCLQPTRTSGLQPTRTSGAQGLLSEQQRAQVSAHRSLRQGAASNTLWRVNPDAASSPPTLPTEEDQFSSVGSSTMSSSTHLLSADYKKEEGDVQDVVEAMTPHSAHVSLVSTASYVPLQPAEREASSTPATLPATNPTSSSASSSATSISARSISAVGAVTLPASLAARAAAVAAPSPKPEQVAQELELVHHRDGALTNDEKDADDGVSRWQISSSTLAVLEQVYQMETFPGACSLPAAACQQQPRPCHSLSARARSQPHCPFSCPRVRCACVCAGLETRRELSRKLNVSARQVQVWFQNRRQRERKLSRANGVLTPGLYAGLNPHAFNAGLSPGSVDHLKPAADPPKPKEMQTASLDGKVSGVAMTKPMSLGEAGMQRCTPSFMGGDSAAPTSLDDMDIPLSLSGGSLGRNSLLPPPSLPSRGTFGSSDPRVCAAGSNAGFGAAGSNAGFGAAGSNAAFCGRGSMPPPGGGLGAGIWPPELWAAESWAATSLGLSSEQASEATRVAMQKTLSSKQASEQASEATRVAMQKTRELLASGGLANGAGALPNGVASAFGPGRPMPLGLGLGPLPLLRSFLPPKGPGQCSGSIDGAGGAANGGRGESMGSGGMGSGGMGSGGMGSDAPDLGVSLNTMLNASIDQEMSALNASDLMEDLPEELRKELLQSFGAGGGVSAPGAPTGPTVSMGPPPPVPMKSSNTQKMSIAGMDVVAEELQISEMLDLLDRSTQEGMEQQPRRNDGGGDDREGESGAQERLEPHKKARWSGSDGFLSVPMARSGVSQLMGDHYRSRVAAAGSGSSSGLETEIEAETSEGAIEKPEVATDIETETSEGAAGERSAEAAAKVAVERGGSSVFAGSDGDLNAELMDSSTPLKLVVTITEGPMGAALKDQRDHVLVSKVEAGSVAEAQGVKVGARVHKVNGECVAGLTKDAVKAMIRAASRPLTVELQQVKSVHVPTQLQEGGMSELSSLSSVTLELDKVAPFLIKLFEIVSSPSSDDLICWSEHGDSFRISDRTKFAQVSANRSSSARVRVTRDRCRWPEPPHVYISIAWFSDQFRSLCVLRTFCRCTSSTTTCAPSSRS